MSVTSTNRRSVLAEIAREELVRLVYGEITSPEDFAKLAALADAAGIELEDILPARGEPGHDPRTHRPAARQVAQEVAEEEPAAPESEESAVEEEPAPGDQEFEAFKRSLFSDVAELLQVGGARLGELQTLIASWKHAVAVKRAITAIFQARLERRDPFAAALAA